MTALITTGTRVRPEWIDYNGHLMDGYYLVAFSDATEGVLAELGFGAAYRERTRLHDLHGRSAHHLSP